MDAVDVKSKLLLNLEKIPLRFEGDDRRQNFDWYVRVPIPPISCQQVKVDRVPHSLATRGH